MDALQQAGVMALLRPLLLDNVASIQQSAAMALGRLVSPLRLEPKKLSSPSTPAPLRGGKAGRGGGGAGLGGG